MYKFKKKEISTYTQNTKGKIRKKDPTLPETILLQRIKKNVKEKAR